MEASKNDGHQENITATNTAGDRAYHPNGKPIHPAKQLKRPKRNDAPFKHDIFPNTALGKILNGLVRSFLIKQEPRLGWARKSACDDQALLPHPCEMVAAHQWGVAWLITVLSRSELFVAEIPSFDHAKAYEMAIIHDLAELETGDITPVDGIIPEEKHRLEAEAMTSILGHYPVDLKGYLHSIYTRYEDRHCLESKFVKDCDRLDFMISAFVYERQGFSGFSEFYTNSSEAEFSTNIARDLASLITTTRNGLVENNTLFQDS